MQRRDAHPHAAAVIAPPSPASIAKAPTSEIDGIAAVLDLAIIGAGPHALALYTRLLDEDPDVTGDFFVGVGSRAQATRTSRRQLFSQKRCRPDVVREFSRRVAVIDPAGQWCAQWDKQFSALQIEYLRSTSDEHPACFDSFALQTFADARKRGGEMRVFDAPRDGSRHRQHITHAAPSADLFLDFCAHLVARYGIADVVRADRVEAIDGPRPSDGTFCLRLHGANTVLRARRVVVATGATTVPRIPAWAEEFVPCRQETHNAPLAARPPPGAIAHAWEIICGSCARGIACATDSRRRTGAKQQAKPKKQSKKKATQVPQRHKASCGAWTDSLRAEQPRILIVGGGLTALHLLRCAVKHHGARRVRLVAREHAFNVKQFDIDLPWVGWSTRPKLINKFLRAGAFEDRLAMLRAARGRGSVTPEALAGARATLDECACKEGWDVRLDEGLNVESLTWQAGDGGEKGEWAVDFDDGSAGRFDRIWLCTGSELDVRRDPLLGPLVARRPIGVVGGLPALAPSLRWDKHTALYVMGAFAALQLGPDALNLAGSRTGAARVSYALRDAVRAGGARVAVRRIRAIHVRKGNNKNANVFVRIESEGAECSKLTASEGDADADAGVSKCRRDASEVYAAKSAIGAVDCDVSSIQLGNTNNMHDDDGVDEESEAGNESGCECGAKACATVNAAKAKGHYIDNVA